MQPSSRLEQIPPYLFAELERKVAAKRAQGIDVISLGIGDPDLPTFEPIVAAAQRAVADPSTHGYPTNRGRQEFRDAVTAFYARRFGVTLDPETEVMPAIGAKECVFNLNLAFLDPGDVALAGFDETIWSSLVEPAITTLAQPTAEIGKTATELLLQRIASPQRPPRKVILQGELHVRGSSAARHPVGT